MVLVSALQGIVFSIIAVFVWEVYSGFYLQLWSQWALRLDAGG